MTQNILLSALINIGIGAYFTYRKVRWRLVVQMLGSVLIVIASVLFTAAFFYEPKLEALAAPLTQRAMFLIAYGTLFYLLSGLREKQGSLPQIPTDKH